jgi:hypothetical protein
MSTPETLRNGHHVSLSPLAAVDNGSAAARRIRQVVPGADGSEVPQRAGAASEGPVR